MTNLKFPFDDMPIDALDELDDDGKRFVFLLKAAWERSPRVFAGVLEHLANQLPTDDPAQEQLHRYIAGLREACPAEARA